MREKIKRECAIVREEFEAGRLRWCYAHANSLIQPYPARRCDKMLQKLGEHTQLEEGEAAYAEDEMEDDASEELCSESECSADEHVSDAAEKGGRE